jgi:hypothetical protein
VAVAVAVVTVEEDTVETAEDMVAAEDMAAAAAAAVDLTGTAAEVAVEAMVVAEAEDMVEDTPLTRLLNRISLPLTEVLLRILPPLGLPNRTTLLPRHTTPTNWGVCGLILDKF